ncbi:MAG: 3-methyl-2-oxobutanoate hydroxymethyltransferase, partial [Proteobacteria bacterium]|nr:3-methyl-2-oxobutanoate hydroxymethyltransferase [Pseudomonadota bacterium]
CDAQVLVLQDALGMSAGKKAKFVRTFANVGEVVTNALAQYVAEVKEGTYPSDAESYH